MSAGLMSKCASAPPTDGLTPRQSSRARWGPPTPVSTSTAPPGWVTTKPCTGHRPPPAPCRLARGSRLISIDNDASSAVAGSRALGEIIHAALGADAEALHLLGPGRDAAPQLIIASRVAPGTDGPAADGYPGHPADPAAGDRSRDP